MLGTMGFGRCNMQMRCVLEIGTVAIQRIYCRRVASVFRNAISHRCIQPKELFSVFCFSNLQAAEQAKSS
jgi:hypothetical protein